MKVPLLAVVWLWQCCAGLEGSLQDFCPVEDTYCKCSPPDGGFIDISQLLNYPVYVVGAGFTMCSAECAIVYGHR